MSTPEREVRWSKGTNVSLKTHLLFCGLVVFVGAVWSYLGPGLATPLIAVPLGMMILPPYHDLYENQKTMGRYIVKTVSLMLVIGFALESIAKQF